MLVNCRPSGEISGLEAGAGVEAEMGSGAGVGATAESDPLVEGVGAGASCLLAFDIEALSGQADEEIFQARGFHGETADGDAGVDQFGGDPLRWDVA